MDRARYEAVHRALLTGLLSNIGQKTDVHEYTGARGRKFHLFPGSGLFSRKPPWVMAGEMTETTRLYARTVARIDPAWVERAAEHLVKREYLDPHWHRDSAHVIAFERVTLYGLVLVHRRRVHYGPIDPKASREIFIRQALVEGDTARTPPTSATTASSFATSSCWRPSSAGGTYWPTRRRAFAFYDARIPAGDLQRPAVREVASPGRGEGQAGPLHVSKRT